MSSVLVLLMIPGMGLFYSGLAHCKSALSLIWLLACRLWYCLSSGSFGATPSLFSRTVSIGSMNAACSSEPREMRPAQLRYTIVPSIITNCTLITLYRDHQSSCSHLFNITYNTTTLDSSLVLSFNFSLTCKHQACMHRASKKPMPYYQIHPE